jgi:cysteinyl-tRNA synthetase
MRIHDTQRAELVNLPERTPNETSLYVCGPTVYGYIHVGNARPAVAFDVLARHLSALGRKVVFVRNFTDIDDKIIDLALETGEDPKTITERFIAAYHADVDALNCQRPNHEPRVSEFLPQIIQIIQTLIDKGLAYVSDGDVYYATNKFEGYGKLSKRKLEDLRPAKAAESEQAAREVKSDPLDFALWKGAKPHEPKSARWASPWGEGRPGWHIECSAMAGSILGANFDLHGGGMDLIFPHHENEIAQSEGANGCALCSAWMHNGFIEFDLSLTQFPEALREEIAALRAESPELTKISKSDRKQRDALLAKQTGLSLREQAHLAVLDLKVKYAHWFQLKRLRERVATEAIRLWMLGTHYRLPLGFEVQNAPNDGTNVATSSDASLDASFPVIETCERQIEYFYETRSRLRGKGADVKQACFDPGAYAATYTGRPGGKADNKVATLLKRFVAAMNDDMNTAQALACTVEAFVEGNRLCDANKKVTQEMHDVLAGIEQMTRVLGIVERDPESYFLAERERISRVRKIDLATIDGLIAGRLEARAAKDFARADVIRQELTALGIEVRDGTQGTVWRFMPSARVS